MCVAGLEANTKLKYLYSYDSYYMNELNDRGDRGKKSIVYIELDLNKFLSLKLRVPLC